ncbi:hypothetical protein SAMN04488107_2977 [Geodermatophilus saharensis]|uniref:Uncharacterized protein n=1 Tax=Geodermatophilus saharensis TaxID=1137994 RepID=A0A239FDW0_9ACTN|nr:hypothetical protein [Geodermatophilus saharensis]SNS55109.1 hypothetical protein SAMN04488107_2977 [Geodermatophilus saharensis]
MTVPVDRPPAAAEEPPPATRVEDAPHAPEDSEKPGIEDRRWLLFAVVVAFIVIAFTGMLVLTALGGGSNYIPWGD